MTQWRKESQGLGSSGNQNWGASTVNIPFSPSCHGSDVVLRDPSTGGGYSFSLLLVSCLWLSCNHKTNTIVSYALWWTKLIFHLCCYGGFNFFFPFLGHGQTEMFSVCSWCPAQTLLVHPSPSCCTNLAANSPSCTFAGPEICHGQLDIRAQRCLGGSAPSLPGGLTTRHWLIHLYKCPAPFLENEQPLTSRASCEIRLEARLHLNPLHCFLSFLPCTASLTFFTGFILASLSVNLLLKNQYPRFSREWLKTHGLYVLKGPCYQLKRKELIVTGESRLKYTFLLLLVRIWNNL